MDKTKVIKEGYNPKNGDFICYGTDGQLLKLNTDLGKLTNNTFNWLVLNDLPRLVLDIQKWDQVLQEREKMPLVSISEILKILVKNHADISKILKYANARIRKHELQYQEYPDFSGFAFTKYDECLELKSTLEKLNNLFEDLFPGFPDFIDDFMNFLITNASDIECFYFSLNDDKQDWQWYNKI